MEKTLWVYFLLDVIFPAIREFLLILISILTPILAGIIVKWYRKVAIDTLVRRKVQEAVLDSQEKFWHRDGKERYSYAVMKVKDLLNDEGIKVSDDRLNSLIPSTVNLLRSGKGWFPEGD